MISAHRSLVGMRTLPLPAPAMLLLGPTGAGKSPLGDYLAHHGFFGHRCHHLDFGSELRTIAAFEAPSGVYSDDERSFIRGVLSGGLLLENEQFILAEKIILLFLERSFFSLGDILVLNGIPRHAGQTHDLASLADIRAVIELSCSTENVYCRLGSNIGGDRAERKDDHDDLVMRKLAIYRERTAPLLAFYREQSARIFQIPVGPATTAAEKFRFLSALAAADPPFSLVAEPPQR